MKAPEIDSKRVRRVAWLGVQLWVLGVATKEISPREWFEFMHQAATDELKGETKYVEKFCSTTGLGGAL